MDSKSKYQFRLPESFHPGELLRTFPLIRLADDARYFVSLILTKTARGQVDDSGYVRLKAKYLRSIMHKHDYNKVVDALLDGGAVERVAYQVGENSFGYQLAKRFLCDKHVRLAAKDPRLIGRLRLFHEQAECERHSRMKPVHFALERIQQQLKIDGDQAWEILESLPPKSNPWDCQGLLVRDIEDQDFHVNVGRYGRLSNNVTAMKRELRSALRHGSEPLKHVDIKCCQPALIGKVAKETTQQEDRTGQRQLGSIYDAPLKPPNSVDFVNYCKLVQTGQLYDFLLSILEAGNGPKLTRDQLKDRFLVDVIAKRKANKHGAEYPSVVEDTFRLVFPSVFQFIRQFNKDGWEHENLIRRLQQEESKLVIETVAADLVLRHPKMFLLTLHDAIFTTERNIPIVVNAFHAAFDRIGFPMSLKVA
jgi:hypothetical protein